MRTATFPVVRTTPENRAFVESALRPGETLSTFIEETVLQQARRRKEDEAFHARAMEASKRIREGGKTYPHDEVMNMLRDMTDKKKREMALKNNADLKAD